MAIRKIRIDGDPILRKISKPVKEINDKIYELIDDMVETMFHEQGVGIAAVQVGVLRRIIVIDPEPDNEDGDIMVLINPEIVESSGEEEGLEGCLSIPGRRGIVPRPTYVKVKYVNEDGENVEFEAHDFVARELCHEIDHMDGILYKDKMIGDYEQ